MSFTIPACEILDFLDVDGVCTAGLSHSIRDALKKGRLDEARILAAQSVDFCTDMTNGAAYARGIAHAHAAIVAHAAGDLDQAYWDYRYAGTQFDRSDHAGGCWHEAVADLGRGLVAKAQRRWLEASQCFDHGLHLLAHLDRNDKRVKRLTAAFKRRIEEVQEFATRAGDANDAIPIVGKSSAGLPRLAVPVDPEAAQWNALCFAANNYRIKKNIEPRWLESLATRQRGDFFAVEIEGCSMLSAGIEPADYVIFRRQPTCENGNIVVALIVYLEESRSTVKRYFFQNGRIVLKADNPQFEPQTMVFGRDDPGVTILGKAVAVATLKT